MSVVSKIATENYLKTIVKALSIPNKTTVSTGELANLMNVTPGTATTMIKRLEKDGYINYKSHYGISLTEKGSQYGVQMIRRHRLIETFLAKLFDVNKINIHNEAERLEHAVSDSLIDLIDEYLNFPKIDPHGEEIPKKYQTSFHLIGINLANAPHHQHLKVTTFKKAPPFGEYFQKINLTHNSIITILKINTDIGLAELKIDNKIIECPLSILDKVLVEELK